MSTRELVKMACDNEENTSCSQAFLIHMFSGNTMHGDIKLQHEHVSRTYFNLPIELLQKIVRMAHPVSISDSRLWGDTGTNRSRLENILALSLVSRFWRYAIVNDRTTWSVVNLPSPKSQLQEQISRSGRVPLHIFVQLELMKLDEDVTRYSIAFNELDRVKTLVITESIGHLRFYGDFCSELLSLMPRCAPMLEILNVRCSLPNGFKFLSGGSPQLKELSTGSAVFSFPLSSFNRLTTLSICILADRHFSPEMLVGILLAAPLLEFLSLTYFGEEYNYEGSQLVQCSNLKRLQLTGSHAFIAGLLPFLILPPDVSWQFDIRDCTTSIHSLSSIISTVAPVYVDIYINPPTGSRGNIALGQTSWDSFPGSFPDDCLKLSPSIEIVPFVNGTLRTFDLSRVTTISLTVPFEAIPHKFATRDIYGTLVNLRTLSIYYHKKALDGGVSNFETAYLDGLICRDEPNELGLRTVPCPLLERLEIVRPKVSMTGYATYLKACIEARRNAGYAFKSVSVRRVVGDITPDVHALLDDLVEWISDTGTRALFDSLIEQTQERWLV